MIMQLIPSHRGTTRESRTVPAHFARQPATDQPHWQWRVTSHPTHIAA